MPIPRIESQVASVKKPMDKNLPTRLYQLMLKIRLVEERIAEIYPSDKIQSPVHLCIGQEAVSAGVCQAMERRDRIYGTYRNHGLFLAKGGEMKRLFAELYGRDTGCARGKGGSMHMVAPEAGLMGCSAVVTSTIPVATGDALASSMRGRPYVVVAFFGDGAVDEGVFFESANFAVLKNLPIVYVCENNNYAVHSRVSDRHKQTELFRIGSGLGLEGFRSDGNDVRGVYAKIHETLARVRDGHGPVLLEFMTYRLYEHVGAGKDHGEAYRDREKLHDALAHDPLQIAKRFLETELGVSTGDFDEWEKRVRVEIEEAVRFAEASPFPRPERLYEDLFEERNGDY